MMTPIILAALLLIQSGQASPFEGNWRTDVPQNLGSIGMARSGLSFAVQPDKVTITHHWLMASDRRTMSVSEMLETDGKPHQEFNGTPGSTTVAMWLTPYVLEITYNNKRPDGIYTSRVTYTVSADTKTLTERRSVLPANRYAPDTEAVFYR